MASGDTTKSEREAQLIFGIAGGSGSGKSTVARMLLEHFGPNQVQVLVQDSYYKDNADMPFEERVKVNYDHPDAFDRDLFVEHIRALKRGEGVDVPVYDYTRHTRSSETRRLEPSPVIVVEGLLVLYMKPVRDELGVKIFVDTPADIRFIRRLKRDTRDRGRSVESVIAQYEQTVRPMHLAFVEPSKRHADVIFPEGYKNQSQEMLNAKIRQHLRGELIPG